MADPSHCNGNCKRPQYPKRPPYFANKFVRLMGNVCLSQELGPPAYVLLSEIAHTEDAKHYTGAVTYWDSQLQVKVGVSVDAVRRARKRVVAAGWLHYEPGARRRPARYWVLIPEKYAHIPDTPQFSNADGYALNVCNLNPQNAHAAAAQPPRSRRASIPVPGPGPEENPPSPPLQKGGVNGCAQLGRQRRRLTAAEISRRLHNDDAPQ